jgi:hypothetical protein
LIVGTEAADAQRAVTRWESFLRGRDLPFVTLPAAEAGSGSSAITFVVKHPSDADSDPRRAQGYSIFVQTKGDHVEIVVSGASGTGVEAGAEALLGRAGWQDGRLTVQAPLEIQATPFFATREATLCPTGRILTKDPARMKETNYEHWPEDRLRRYPQFLKACGFNSIQIMELIGNEKSPGYRGGGDRAKILPVLRTLADAAHANGMSVSQYIWGSADGYHWDKPEERPKREQRYRELAEAYGPFVDHIITHWIDEGYEGGYVVPQEATAFLWKEYRKHNRGVRATMDTWGNSRIGRGGYGNLWEGDPRARAFLDETFMPREIGIALERWYNAEQAARVRQAGRRVGIWGWYLGDYEMNFGAHLQSRVLDKYFSSLPADAAGTVDWLSIEMCFHALPSQINLYVAGQKMWTPQRALGEILLDYCRSVYGPQNAKAVRLAYETVEAGQKDVKIYGVFIPESDRFPVVRGTPQFRVQAEEALAAIQTVVLSPDWQPNFPVVGSPAEDIKWLREQLETHLKEK